MSSLAITIIAVTAVGAILLVAGASWFALDSHRRVRRFARGTDITPGRPSNAPSSWARSTEPAAILHQRLRYAIFSVHENPMVARDRAAHEARDDLDKAVAKLDDQLVSLIHDSPDSADTLAELRRIDVKTTHLERLPGRLWEATPSSACRHIASVAALLRSVDDIPQPPAIDN